MRVIFMGTPTFAVYALEKLILHHDVCCVVTQPDKPKGRGKKLIPTPVKECAAKHNITVLQPKDIKDADVIEQLKSYSADIIIVSAFGQILPSEILWMCKYGCINIHASLLPKYRGAAPIQRCIMDGEIETGITIMYMEKSLDTGDMLLKRKLIIKPEDNYSAIHDKLALMGADMIIETMEKLTNNTAVRIKQDDAEASYAHMIDKAACVIDFSKTSQAVINQIRALDTTPGAFTIYKGQILKIWKAEKYNAVYNEAFYGEIVDINKNKGLIIKVLDAAIIITEIQGPGSKKMSCPDYLRGHTIKKGEILGLEE